MPYRAKNEIGCRAFYVCLITVLLFAANALAIDVVVERSRDSEFFQFANIPLPATDDAAASGKWALTRGKIDGNSPGLNVLSDGRIPSSDDSPGENFFFAGNGTTRSISLDLGRSVEIAEVVAYSWHAGGRAPQVYTLYGARESTESFQWDHLDDAVDPASFGWEKIAEVDTREERSNGGQHASRIRQGDEGLGGYRYLLFDIQSTDARDPFGQTFFSEIDVVSKSALDLKRIVAPKRDLIEFASGDGRFQYSIDVTAAPNMSDWSESELKPLILDWYPRIVELLPSENFTAPTKIRFRYQPNAKMNGIPAYAQASTVTLNTEWMNREKNREAKGAVVHEMAHIVQAYQMNRTRRNRGASAPGWIVEGIPDYIRWYLYEPHTGGAQLSKEALSKSKHDASYRVSANFIDWVIRTYDRNGGLLEGLNAAAREGRYTSDVWLMLTGKSEGELAELWRAQP